MFKQQLAILLAICCIFVALIFLQIIPEPEVKQSISFTQLDTLIYNELHRDTLILISSLEQKKLKIDSILTREIISVNAYPKFLFTAFHIQIHERLIPYGLKSHAILKTTHDNFSIHIYYRNRVYRTITIKKVNRETTNSS